MRERLSFTRAQLQAVFKDFKSVKEFERLMEMVDGLIPTTIDDIDVVAALTDIKAVAALDAVARLTEALESMRGGPQRDSNDDITKRLDVLEKTQPSPSDTSSDINKRLEDAAMVQPHHTVHSCDIAGALQQLLADVDLIKQAPFASADNSVSTDYIDFPDIGPHISMERRLQWNRDDGTLDVGLYNGVVLQCGQEIHFYAKNASGAMISNGSAVMLTGFVGASGKLEIDLAIADGSIRSDYMLGIATHDINDGDFGYVTSYGLVRGFDASGGSKTVPEAWTDGDTLYLDAAHPGELTKTMPTAPNLKLPIAIVVHNGAGQSGSVYARMKIGDTLHGLHDVNASTPRDLDLLQYNTATARWESGTHPWVDIDFPIIVRTTGAGIPALATLNGNITMPQWAVNDVNICESQELIHSWLEGSACHWHIHLTTNGLDITNRYVRFELEYGYVDVSGEWAFPAAITTADLLIPANTPTKSMLIMSLGSFTPSVHIGGHVVARLKRVAAGGTAPTNNPWIPMLQLHVQIDTIGSRNISAK